MIKDIITDEDALSIKAVDCNMDTVEETIQTLMDTAEANRERCLGLAGNQVGINEKIFVVRTNDGFRPFVNPEITFLKASGRNQAYESCLSRPDKPAVKIKRYNKVMLKHLNIVTGEVETVKYEGYPARIVQHEMGHLNGDLI